MPGGSRFVHRRITESESSPIRIEPTTVGRRLQPGTEFNPELRGVLDGLGARTEIWPVPVEIPGAIPFTEDRTHDRYEPGGGTVRDVLLGQVPAVLRTGLYAIPALLGASLTVACWRADLDGIADDVGAALACLTLRMVGLHYDLNAPRPPGTVR